MCRLPESQCDHPASSSSSTYSCIPAQRFTQFTSAVWAILCKQLGIQHLTTTAYHPQANRMIERFHRQLKDSLRARLAASDWLSHLPWILLGLWSAPKEDHNVSSAELLCGVPLTLPGELLESEEPPAATFLEKLRQTSTSFLPTRPVAGPSPSADPPKALRTADFVFIRKVGAPGPPLSPLYKGPYKVVARGPKFFKLELGDRQETVTVDRLKPFLAQHVVPAAPPCRGCPPLAAT